MSGVKKYVSSFPEHNTTIQHSQHDILDTNTKLRNSVRVDSLYYVAIIVCSTGYFPYSAIVKTLLGILLSLWTTRAGAKKVLTSLLAPLSP